VEQKTAEKRRLHLGAQSLKNAERSPSLATLSADPLHAKNIPMMMLATSAGGFLAE
jgi:hypothetical protein